MTPTPPSSPAIAVTGLRKAYGQQTVLDGIDLDIAAGTIFSLLGPNGAGKTTAVQIMTTLIRADAGDLWVADHSVTGEPDAVRAVIAVTGQFSAVDKLLTCCRRRRRWPGCPARQQRAGVGTLGRWRSLPASAAGR